MKAITRFFLFLIIGAFAWPFLLVEKKGKKDYRLEGNTIIIANHYSDIDPALIYFAFFGQKKITFVTHVGVKKNCWTHLLTWAFDCLYVDYETINVAFFKDSVRLLENGGVLCLFPEGVINPRKYGFFDFSRSYVMLARRAHSKILPLFLYPQEKMFKKSLVYVGDALGEERYLAEGSIENINAYFQSQIMLYNTPFIAGITSLEDLPK